jgi:predicted GH43/DUF377 family glycosyl hydrolase
MTAHRAPGNPVVTPAMIRPSHPDFEVVGAFNPGVTRHEGDVVLLVRVAEAPLERSAGEAAAPFFDARSGRVGVQRWAADTEGLDTSDPRVIVADGRTWLTSLSHLRVARSADGIRFDVEPAPALAPASELESWGIEDARITLLDGTYWINYTAVSPYGIATALASTHDFRVFERHGIIFPPQNRDVTIFPEAIAGRYAALHRPMPEGIGEPAIWIASSSDLMAWGRHHYIAGARRDGWDDAKVGGGAVPFRVRVGRQDAWLAVYHGVRRSPLEYALGALLLDARDPSRVIARSREPILKPDAVYEREGFLGRVVFTCGLLVQDDRVRIYYGAADAVTAVADLSLDEILAGLA